MRRSNGARLRLCLSILGGGGLFIGCGGGAFVFTPVPASPSQRDNVMVIDEGFDLSIAELRGMVSAAYTETCDSGSSVPLDAGADASAGSSTLKEALLAELTVPDTSCHLVPGIGAKPDPLASIAGFRARWNAMIRANQTEGQAFTSSELDKLAPALDRELTTFGYHGTSTAGCVVHENPEVRLVLVERQLSSESSSGASFDCFVQADIDQLVELFDDPQVFAAAVAQTSSLDDDLAAATAAHGVGIVNESYGPATRQALEALQIASGCPAPVDLSAYFAVLDRIEVARLAAMSGPHVLRVVAAGNDGFEIDTGADSLSCDLGDPASLLVGAYDPGNMVRDAFSNHGACVDTYAPGQAVVAPYAGDWLLPVSGTSFAAPLVARQISLTAADPFDPAAARATLLGEAGTDQSLPVTLFPADFFYVPDESPTAAVWPRLSRHLGTRAVSEVELHRVYAPIARLRRLRAR